MCIYWCLFWRASVSVYLGRGQNRSARGRGHVLSPLGGSQRRSIGSYAAEVYSRARHHIALPRTFKIETRRCLPPLFHIRPFWVRPKKLVLKSLHDSSVDIDCISWYGTINFSASVSSLLRAAFIWRVNFCEPGRQRLSRAKYYSHCNTCALW